jgi:hypothetical protein
MKLLRHIAVFCSLGFWPFAAFPQFVTVGIAPPAVPIFVGDSFDAKLFISGLTAGGSPSLGVFDIVLSFDPLRFNPQTVSFGDAVLGDQLDLSGFGSISSSTDGLGTLELFELSLDDIDTLNSLQPAGFLLATINFKALTAGAGMIVVTPIVLGDALGEPLPFNATDFSATIAPRPIGTAVPEPSTYWLGGILVLAAAVIRRKAPR